MEQIYNQPIHDTDLEISHHPLLTSQEIANLWNVALRYSMILRTMQHFHSHVEDLNIRQLLEQGLDIVGLRVKISNDLLNSENHPGPIGFTEEDVDLNAPRLYTDEFYLYFLIEIVKFGLVFNSLGFNTSIRTDVREFYGKNVERNIDYINRISDIALAKGLYVRPPAITTVDQVDLVKEQSFLAGFFRERRPLLADEVGKLHASILANQLGRNFLKGFAQVTNSETVRRYIIKGVNLSEEIINRMSSKLKEGDLGVPMKWAANVTSSTTSPYSNKLMMNLVLSLNAQGIGAFAQAITLSPRNDLAAEYSHLIVKIGKYSNEGLKLMIDNGWYEEPPRTIDFRELKNKTMH